MVAFVGCTDDPAQRLRLRSEATELTHLQRVKALLASDAVRRSDLHVFLSKGVIEQALRQVVPLELPLGQEFGDALLVVREVRAAFGNGYPRLELKASVRSASRGVEAEVITTALLLLDTGAGMPETATLRIAIQDVAPSVAVGGFNFSAAGFWKDLAASALADKLGELPALTLPMAATIPISAGGPTKVTIPTGNGSTVTGRLTLPQISMTVRPHLVGAAFLQDGVHFFYATAVE